MPDAGTTVVVTPWQHFSLTKAALESVYAFTPEPFELVYVDGNSPRPIRDYLRTQARERGFTLVREERYLTSSEAHNLALPHVRTHYAVFLDNGTFVTPGWLDALVRCQRETGAWMVSPIYCTGNLRRMLTYSAAPDLRIVEDQGQRRLFETAPYAGKPLAEVRAQLQRSTCGYVKSHCMLTTRAVLDELGPFDEGYTNFQEHRDFCLEVQARGGQLYFEPDAVAVIVNPPPFAWNDLPLFLLRWSDAWLQPSMQHFAQKWRLDVNDHTLQGGARFRDTSRRRLFWIAQGAAGRLFGSRGRRVADRLIDLIFKRILEPTVVAALERRRLAASAAGPRITPHAVPIGEPQPDA